MTEIFVDTLDRYNYWFLEIFILRQAKKKMTKQLQVCCRIQINSQ